MGAEAAADLALRALRDVEARRAGADHPALYTRGDNPWTDQIARALRDALAGRLRDAAGERHAVAARWRFPTLLADGPVSAQTDPLYDIAWRVYARDGSALIAQPLVVECAWRGGWRRQAGAADRLAQARARVKLLCTQDDPGRPVGAMTLAQACAFRIAAFAPPGESVLLAFYGRDATWRDSPGFTVLRYITGDDQVEAVNLYG